MKLTSKCPISVTILTKNEQTLLPRCLRSLQWADEVLVLDSGSSDETKSIAKSMGASVHEQQWLGWVPQRQAAIRLAKHDWVLIIEADELVTPELARGIIVSMNTSPRPEDGYVVDRRDELFGTLLPNMKRRALRNDFVRLFNRTRSHYRSGEVIHETVDCPGRRHQLPGLLLHWRNVTFTEAMLKDVSNAELEAQLMMKAGTRVGLLRLTLMPVARFGWCYLVRGAWRAGTVGLIYSLMRAHADFLRHVRSWEQQNVRVSVDPPPDVWRSSDMPKVHLIEGQIDVDVASTTHAVQ